jgi:hypothetical protein
VIRGSREQRPAGWKVRHGAALVKGALAGTRDVEVLVHLIGGISHVVHAYRPPTYAEQP